jgi:hypothetical protein
VLRASSPLAMTAGDALGLLTFDWFQLGTYRLAPALTDGKIASAIRGFWQGG